MAKRSTLLLRLLSRMGEMEFRESYIPKAKGCHTFGCWDPDGTITVNPYPHVVDTILHELLHELHPEYSERAVQSIVGKLMKGMSEVEIQTIYAEYKRRLEE